MSRENPAPPQEGTTIGAKLMAKLGFFDNDILGPDINQDIMIDSSLENENRTAQDPIEFTEEAIYEDQMAFWESKSNRRMLLNNKKSKKKKSSGEKEEVVLHQRGEKQEEKQQQQQSQQQQQAALWRLPAKQNPDQVYVYASLETPGAFGKDLMNEGLLSQVDYITHGNEKASSLWLPQMISTKGLMASYEAFSRSKQTRIPGHRLVGKELPGQRAENEGFERSVQAFPGVFHR